MANWIEKAKKIRDELELPLDHPMFYPQLHARFAKDVEGRAAGNPLQLLFQRQHEDISRPLSWSQIQHGTSVRHKKMVRELVNWLFTDEGRLLDYRLQEAISYLRANLYCLGPRRRYDAQRREHVLTVLSLLQKEKNLRNAIQRVTKPVAHHKADELIRDTLALGSKTVTDAHARKAVLSAWLTYLRQTVGSCFATAPAILVHKEQPEIFLKDLTDLLSTGRLTRVVGGKEFSVPLSQSWGGADLKRPLLLFRDLKKSPLKVWHSPGITAALEASGILPSEDSPTLKARKLRGWIHKAAEALHPETGVFFTCAEELIRTILLRHFKITEEEIHGLESTPPPFVVGGLVAPKSQPSGLKTRDINAFHLAFEMGCKAFKSLTENPLLKAWEYSLASFAETKASFTRWNLYSSLGFQPEEKGGIGFQLYQFIKERLDIANQEAREYQDKYEQVFVQVQLTENRLRRATTEKDVRWLKAEYQNRNNEAYHYAELRDIASNRAHKMAELFHFLLSQYDAKFQDYFQEIYDADMQDVQAGLYDDSPAGFRLLYKHGRSNTSQWTMIHGPEEFIEALAAFFVATEAEIAAEPFLEDLQNDFSFMVTQLVTHIRTPEFLTSALQRMAKAHGLRIPQHPLEDLDKLPKKPWVYTSGGTMNNLVQCYFGSDQLPDDVMTWVDGPDELLAFVIDSLKQLPRHWAEEIEDVPGLHLLMHSPTHAFLLLPGLEPFQQAWRDPVYSYTWIKDHVILPGRERLNRILLDDESMRYLIERMSLELPEDLRSLFRHQFPQMGGKMKVSEFRNFVVDNLRYAKGLHYHDRGALLPSEIDALLYQILPLTRGYHLREDISQIFKEIDNLEPNFVENVEEAIEHLCSPYDRRAILTAKQLRQICLSLLMLATDEVTNSRDMPLQIVKAMQKQGLALAPPLIFADTNWQTDYFAFLVNPGTDKLDLWRVDYTGSTGEPMVQWKPWLDGSRQDPQWGIYIRPEQYRR